ncbi:MAG: hypothetical protein Q9182_002237 [Xanthomendoza sp. 2 TL-2023]
MASVNYKAINLWTARVIPTVLVGLAGYTTWVVVVLVCVDYLLKPAPTVHKPRSGAGIAILTVYTCLLLLLALTYFRLAYTVITNPGYASRGPQWRRAKPTPSDLEKQNGSLGQHSTYSETLSASPYNHDSSAYGPAEGIATPGLQDFYKRDVFTCESDGRPIWCSTCLNWKPDRAHHCREVGRCVRKMDHFCPWVGGIVSETSQKFFVLFVTWGSIYCVFTLAIMAKFVAERPLGERGKPIECLGRQKPSIPDCAALFSLFLLGMGASSLQFVLQNTTTIENLSRRTKVWQLAIYIPNTSLQNDKPPLFRTITYGTDPNSIRTFAILHSRPGENPWDLGYFRNFKAVMGEHWYDWILPIKLSPCAKHDRLDCEFETGPVVERMKREAGINTPIQPEIEEKPRRHRRRRRRRRSTHGQAEAPTVENNRTDGERRKRHHRHQRRRSESRRQTLAG